MMTWLQMYNGALRLVQLLIMLFIVMLLPYAVLAQQNIIEYKDMISDSGPGEYANHTLEFVTLTSLSPGSVIEVTPPAGFSMRATSTFGVRNVDLLVDGVRRSAAGSAGAGVDGVTITTGSPGKIEYQLASDSGISANSRLTLKIGNHTFGSIYATTTFSTSTGTTTTPGDVEPISNSADLGRHDMQLRIYDGGLVARANPIIFMVEKVNLPNIDTRETDPPLRLNGAPSSTVTGVTPNVELSLQTNEFAVCKYGTTAGVEFGSMANTFPNTGVIFHSVVVPVTPESENTFYVRCIDDEGNFNIDDYVIAFAVSEIPTGQANEEGEANGDGSGTGDAGENAGSGSGTGGTDAGSGGGSDSDSGSSGGGGGGGGGGGRGRDNDDEAGGGFENTDAAFESGDGRVVISGLAPPNARVVAVVDGTAAESTTAGSDGFYELTIDEIARGAYTFGIYAEDENDVRSSTINTSFTVSGARTSELSNINVYPTFSVDPDPVDPGAPLTVSGYTIPNAEVTLENGRDNAPSANTLTAQSDADGFWSVSVDTSRFSQGTYRARARAVLSATRSTNFSEYTYYGVGQQADVPTTADLNQDGSVNLVDFSVLLFWWGSDGGDSLADINDDGNVSLTDFSIMLFNWTG